MKTRSPRHTGLLLLALAGAALPLLSTSGCRTVGPEFRPPAPPATAQSFVNAPGRAAASPDDTGAAGSILPPAPAAPAEGNWWTLLGDAELDRLEARALENSPSLVLVAARIAESRARLGLARADERPALSTTDSARLAGESSERTLPIPTRPVTYRDAGDSYRLSLDASWEPDLWGRIRRSVEAARAQLEAGEADARAARLVLTADLAAAYIGLRGLEAEADILARTRTLRADSLSLLSSRHSAGLAPETEVHRARAELAALDAEQADLGRRHALALNSVALLCGSSVSELQLQPTGRLPAVPRVPAGIPADVLRRRPDIAAAEALLHARTAEIGVAEAARYPTIRLTAGGGFESPDLLALLDRPSQFWQLGPSLTLPILDGGRTRANLAAAQARADAARADHRQKCLVALREVEDALVDLRQLAAQAGHLAQARDSAGEALRLLRSRHEAGLISYLEVVDAERSQLQFERSLVQNSGARAAASLRLIRALGGAW